MQNRCIFYVHRNVDVFSPFLLLSPIIYQVGDHLSLVLRISILGKNSAAFRTGVQGLAAHISANGVDVLISTHEVRPSNPA